MIWKSDIAFATMMLYLFIASMAVLIITFKYHALQDGYSDSNYEFFRVFVIVNLSLPLILLGLIAVTDDNRVKNSEFIALGE